MGLFFVVDAEATQEKKSGDQPLISPHFTD
jgi:hypothetical protein